MCAMFGLGFLNLGQRLGGKLILSSNLQFDEAYQTPGSPANVHILIFLLLQRNGEISFLLPFFLFFFFFFPFSPVGRRVQAAQTLAAVWTRE